MAKIVTWRHEVSQCHWKNGANRLARCRLAPKCQCVRNTVSVLHKKVRCACTSCHFMAEQYSTVGIPWWTGTSPVTLLFTSGRPPSAQPSPNWWCARDRPSRPVLPGDPRVQLQEDGQVLRITSSHLGDEGRYQCVAFSPAGQQTKDFQLRMQGELPPTTPQPRLPAAWRKDRAERGSLEKQPSGPVRLGGGTGNLAQRSQIPLSPTPALQLSYS